MQDLEQILSVYRKEFTKKKSYEDYTKTERVLFGLSYFTKDELQELTKEMFAGREQLSYSEIEYFLFSKEGLSKNDIEDLMAVLCIKEIIKATEYPNFITNVK